MDVLVIEDCLDTVDLIKKALDGHLLIHCETIQAARKTLFEKDLNLILIDVELPDGNGVDFCSELNADPRFTNIPKIILTSKDRTADKVFGLYSGADDYVTKPFAPQELRARCEVRVKKQLVPKIETFGVFQFNSELQNLNIIDEGKNQELVNLTPLEYKITYFLVSNPGKTFTRQEIVRKIWVENGTVIEARGLDTHISHIRTKLGQYGKCIVSVYGKGYNFTTSPIKSKKTA